MFARSCFAFATLLSHLYIKGSFWDTPKPSKFARLARKPRKLLRDLGLPVVPKDSKEKEHENRSPAFLTEPLDAPYDLALK